jgi:hypothetical protein
MLLLENGETNKCQLEFDVNYKLSTDTNQVQIYTLTLVQTHNAVFNPLTPELNTSVQRWLTRFFLEILFLEPCISLIYMREKSTNATIIYSVY